MVVSKQVYHPLPKYFCIPTNKKYLKQIDLLYKNTTMKNVFFNISLFYQLFVNLLYRIKPFYKRSDRML